MQGYILFCFCVKFQPKLLLRLFISSTKIFRFGQNNTQQLLPYCATINPNLRTCMSVKTGLQIDCRECFLCAIVSSLYYSSLLCIFIPVLVTYAARFLLVWLFIMQVFVIKLGRCLTEGNPSKFYVMSLAALFQNKSVASGFIVMMVPTRWPLAGLFSVSSDFHVDSSRVKNWL
jgi:hypothetical protein